MKGRCLRETVEGFRNYGGRESEPITVCDEWLDSFERFYADMGPRPSASHTIERKDNDGGYCADNCIWDTREHQSRNTRKNVFLTLNGECLTAAEWATKLPIKLATIYYRKKQGWSDEKTLTTPPR